MNPTLEQVIPVARPSVGAEEENAVVQVLRSGWVSQGPRVAEFEDRFAAYVGARHAVAVSSCTSALHLALLAAQLGPGDEVICPSLSFIATANAIRYIGAVPTFVDVEDSTFNLNPYLTEKAVTPRTKAILAVHQIGMPAALDEISCIADRLGLVVIEDAACAVGSEYKGQRIGAPRGMMACFSFHPRKVLTTGEGGMITTADPRLAARLRRLRQHAMSVSDLARHQSNTPVTECYDEVGFNYRMTDLQAALGLVQLSRLDAMIAKRRRLAQRYTEILSRFPWIKCPSEPFYCRSNFQSYMIRISPDSPLCRDEVMARLLTQGISTRRGIMAIHRELPYRSQSGLPKLPVTEALADDGLILPLYHDMDESDQDRIVCDIAALAA